MGLLVILGAAGDGVSLRAPGTFPALQPGPALTAGCYKLKVLGTAGFEPACPSGGVWG
jgi:hypothetical protein